MFVLYGGSTASLECIVRGGFGLGVLAKVDRWPEKSFVSPWDGRTDGCLHLVGQHLRTRDPVGLQGALPVKLAVGLRVVVFIEPANAVHLIVDAAGDVL